MCRNKKVSNIVIVGNGLDLHHGLKTSFKNFIDIGMSEETKEKMNYFKRRLGDDKKEENWYDLESFYRTLVLETQTSILSNKGINKDNKNILSTEMREINEWFHILMHELANYLKSINTGGLYRIDTKVEQYLRKADIIVTFNYTNTLQELYNIPEKKIIHVHGKLDTFPIFGHSNFLYFKNGGDYGQHYMMQQLSEEMIEGNVETFNAQTKEWKEKKTSGEVKRIPNIENIMFGDKNLQRIIMMELDHFEKTQQKSGYTFFEMNEIFNDPFAPFPNRISFKNKLAIDFDSLLNVIIIGHGLKSDVDLLSKIKSSKKLVTVLNGPNYYNKELYSSSKNIFKVTEENIMEKEYDW